MLHTSFKNIKNCNVQVKKRYDNAVCRIKKLKYFRIEVFW